MIYSSRAAIATIIVAYFIAIGTAVVDAHPREWDFPPKHFPMFVAGTRLLTDLHFKAHHEKHRPFLAMYYRHNDDACRAFLREWRDAVHELTEELGKDTIDNRLVAIDCNRIDSEELCKGVRFHRCPTLKWFEEITPHKAPRHFIKEVLEADGYTRTKEGVKRFVHDHKGLMRPPDRDDDSNEAAMYDPVEGEEINLDAIREEDAAEDSDGEGGGKHSEL